MSFYNRFRAGGQLGSGSGSSSSSSSSYMSGFRSGGNLGQDGSEAKKTESGSGGAAAGEKKETHSISNSMSYLEVRVTCSSLTTLDLRRWTRLLDDCAFVFSIRATVHFSAAHASTKLNSYPTHKLYGSG